MSEAVIYVLKTNAYSLFAKPAGLRVVLHPGCCLRAGNVLSRLSVEG
ncbi:hypothetical protein [Rahnella perminowiae]